MPKTTIIDVTGAQVGEIELSDSVFGIEPNEVVMHSVVVNYLANQRQGTQSTLTRAEVSGGGRKPWKQKGTGNARQGSTRSPQWRHGGITFGPKPRDYRYSLNKKVRRLAIKSAFSVKAAAGDIIVLDSLNFDDIKTKNMVTVLGAIGIDKKALIVLPNVNENVIKSARNIPGISTAQINTLNVYDILHHDKFIIVKEAVATIEEVYA